MKKPLLLIGLNEVNFDVVRRYVDEGIENFPSLRRLLASHAVRTTCETRYELLEPWIQWPSVHTGKSYEEHQLFRLGDVVDSNVRQVFEELEGRGYVVGAVSPMNAANRLRRPAYFIPDPWTETTSDGSMWSRKLHAAVSQAVNDNAQSRLRFASIVHLFCGLVRFARPKNYSLYLRLAFGALKSPWRKALLLDLFLHDLHMRNYLRFRPDFSVLFLNAGAHIQHHYFLNAYPLRRSRSVRNPEWYVAASADPVAEMLAVYDHIAADYLDLKSAEKIFATGLSQRPYDRVKFYYRLKDHAAFLAKMGIQFRAVNPRMTRDFLVEFSDNDSAADAECRLRSVLVRSGGRSAPLFGEVDNRGTSLFVTLTYPEEIGDDDDFELDGNCWKLAPHVVFVAIKNGMHQEDGFAYFSDGIARFAPQDGAHVKSLHDAVISYFSPATVEET